MDGTYDFFDLIEVSRVLDVVDENKRRAAEAQQQNQR